MLEELHSLGFLLGIMKSIEVLLGISYINQITARLRPDHIHDRGFFISVKLISILEK